MTSASTILSNPVWLMWPEALMVMPAVIYLVGLNRLKLDSANCWTPMRLMAFVGLLATASLVLLGVRPSLYTIVAIPALPAPFAFGVLVFRPRRILNWQKIRVYLTICVVASALCWVTQIIWLLTR